MLDGNEQVRRRGQHTRGARFHPQAYRLTTLAMPKASLSSRPVQRISRPMATSPRQLQQGAAPTHRPPLMASTQFMALAANRNTAPQQI